MLMAGSGWDNSGQLSSSNCHTLKIFMLKVEKWDKNQKAMPYYPKVLTVVFKQDILTSKTVSEDYMYIDMRLKN